VQPLRHAAALFGFLAVSGAAVGVAAHYVGRPIAVRVAAFTPLLVVLAVIAVVLLVVARRPFLTVLAAGVAAVGLWSQLPQFVGAAATPASDRAITVRLMQANIFFGQADAATLVRTVRDERVDVLTVIELTPDSVRRLAAAGLHDTLPYSFLDARPGGAGAGIFSRFPLSDGMQLKGLEMANLKAVAQVPGVGPTLVYALHPLPPYPGPPSDWAHELLELRGVFEVQAGRLIVGADFNSTFDHRQYRDILRSSPADGGHPLIDAAEFLGAGIVATYPADRRYPPVLAIDKILTRGGTPVSLRRVHLPGSDHRGLIGDIRFDATV